MIHINNLIGLIEFLLATTLFFSCGIKLFMVCKNDNIICRFAFMCICGGLACVLALTETYLFADNYAILVSTVILIGLIPLFKGLFF